jgi:hypothetical protein
VSCKNQNNISPVQKLFETNPSTITWNGSASDVESFSASVNVYTMNNRITEGFRQTSKYRIAFKKIGGLSYSRVDLDKNYAGGVLRTVITDGTDMIIVDGDTNKIESRIKVPKNESPALDFLTASPITGRVNIDEIRTEAKRLKLDVTEDEDERGMIIAIPASLLPTKETEKYLSAKITLDTSTETLNEIEIITMNQEGIVTTSTSINVYQECDDELVKIGTITTIDTQNPNIMEGELGDMEIFNNIDEIPEISDEQFNSLQESGNIYENPGIVLGDPSDLSNVQTIVEVYETVELNEVDNSVFKLLIGEKL